MKINSYLRYGIYSGLALILLVPLVVTTSMYFPFITGKNFLFRIVVEIIFAAWLILAAREPAVRPRRNILLWSTLGLLVVSTLATIFSVNPYHSFWSNFERMDGLITQIHLFLYFLVASSVLATRGAWRNFFNWSLAVAAVVAGYGTLQLFGALPIHQGATRLDASLGNSAYLAVYLLFHLFLAAYLAATDERSRRWLQGIYSLLGLWFLLILYYTQTRGTIIGLLGGLVIAGGLLAWRGSKKAKQTALGLILALLVLIGLFVSLKNTALIQGSETLQRLASISLHEQTVESRFAIWQMSLEGVREHPVLGWGPESFIYVFSKYYQPNLWNQEPWFDRSHNVFLDWLVAAGALGLLAYLTLFGSAIFLLIRRDFAQVPTSIEARREAIGSALLLGLLAAYLCHNFFVFDNLVSYILFYSLLAYLAAVKIPGASRRLGGPQVYSAGFNSVLLGLVIISLAASLYWLNLKPILASQNLIQAMTTNSPAERLTFYQTAFGLKTFASHEALEQYLATANQMLEPAVPVVVREGYSRLAVEQITAESGLAGPDARFAMVIGSFLTNVGRYDDALVYLNQAKVYSPNKQAVYFQLASVYINQQNFTKAFETAEAARQLAPDYPEANVMSILVAIYGGRFDDANRLLIAKKDNPSVILDNRLMTAYSFAKRPDEAAKLNNLRVDLYQQLIKADSNNVANYTALSDLLTELGQVDQAKDVLAAVIPVLKRNLAADPGNKDAYLALAGLYFRLGDNAEVTAIITQATDYFNQQIKANPRDTKNYLSLAGLFASANRPDLARQVIEQGIRANQSFTYEGQAFLAKLPAAK